MIEIDIDAATLDAAAAELAGTERVVVLHTGQHEAVAEVLYQFFDMGPDIRLPTQRRTHRLGQAGQQIITGGCVNDSKLQGRAATVKNKNQLTHE